MQNGKPIASMVFECYFFNQPLHCRYGLHYNVLLEMMMPVLQHIGGLTILSRRKTSFHAQFQVQRLHFDIGIASIVWTDNYQFFKKFSMQPFNSLMS